MAEAMSQSWPGMAEAMSQNWPAMTQNWPGIWLKLWAIGPGRYGRSRCDLRTARRQPLMIFPSGFDILMSTNASDISTAHLVYIFDMVFHHHAP